VKSPLIGSSKSIVKKFTLIQIFHIDILPLFGKFTHRMADHRRTSTLAGVIEQFVFVQQAQSI